MEYKEYKKKYENIEGKFKKLFEEVGEDKEKRKVVIEKKIKEKIELVKIMEKNDDYNRTGKLSRLYINLRFSVFVWNYVNFSDNNLSNYNCGYMNKCIYSNNRICCNDNSETSFLYNSISIIDEYLKKDFYNLDMQIKYLLLVVLDSEYGYFDYEGEYKRCVELLKDSIFEKFARQWFEMDADNFYLSNGIKKEGIEDFINLKNEDISSSEEDMYMEIYNEVEREIEERNLRRDW